MSRLAAFALFAAAGSAAAQPMLPPPFATPSVTKQAKVLGWPEGQTPTAPAGFRVTPYLTECDSPRWLYTLPNGDVLLAESNTTKGKSPNRVVLLRGVSAGGAAAERHVLLTGLNQPLGMVYLDGRLYVANTDGLNRYPYTLGQTKLDAPAERVLALPGGGYNNHWTRNVVVRPDGKKLYVSVGSGTNVDVEGVDVKDPRRAAVLECDPDGRNMRVFAGGLRNPVGMAQHPATGVLWAAVNERDLLGDDLVPDYMTSVKDGGFYGWPYSYFGQNEDPRQKGNRPDLVAKAIVPDVPLGAHTASLGLAFQRGDDWPAKYRGGAFVGQRGSWNRSSFSGYRVAFVPFKGGQPAGPHEEFMGGFIKTADEVYGRPVGVAFAADGALLVADEVGKRVWRVAAVKE